MMILKIIALCPSNSPNSPYVTVHFNRFIQPVGEMKRELIILTCIHVHFICMNICIKMLNLKNIKKD